MHFPLRFRFSGTPQRHRLGWACVVLPFRCLSSSGDQLLGERTVPGGRSILITSPVPAAQFPGCTTKAPSLVCYVFPLGSWSQVLTLLADVNHPGSQEDLVSNWEPAHSLVEDASLWAEISPYLLALAVACLPPCLWWKGRGLYAAR